MSGSLVLRPAASTPWMAQAWIELGQREIAGAGDNARILALYRDTGHREIAHDDVAWCAAFIGACLERAGIESTRSLLARSYLQWGESLSAPLPGAICVFSRGDDPTAGHAGFWLGETGTGIVVLGGNQGDAVSVTVVPKSRLLSCRWPKAAAVTPDRTSRDFGPSGSTSTSTFEKALQHVLAMEGGYTNDPADPGGPTNQGITLEDYAGHTRTPVTAATRSRLVAELKSIAPEVVRDIYRGCYWTPSRAGAMPAALALMHFDTAVNQGLGTAARLLQRALAVEPDGVVGSETLRAAVLADVGQTLEQYALLRRERYRQLHHFPRFGRGWLRRVDSTITAARECGNAVPPQLDAGDQPMMQTQATPQDVSAAPQGKWWGHSLTIWGAIVTGLTTVLPAVAPALGLDLSAEMVRQIGEQTSRLVQAAGGLAGTLMTIYGRTRASAPLERREVRMHL
jgi:uncharacterized protein (TIGR02594 family)